MRWRGRRQSKHVIDVRGGRRSVRTTASGFVLLCLLGALAVYAGEDPVYVVSRLLESGVRLEAKERSRPSRRTEAAPRDEYREFVAVVLADLEAIWTRQFSERNLRYHAAKLVLYEDAISSACGRGQKSIGPFYCPADARVYLDVSFFRELEALGAPGDFAQAYVIAHEVAHHVQQLLGIHEQTQALRSAGSGDAVRVRQIAVELHADCLAGLWGHYARAQRNFLEAGDIEEGLKAAASIGDDSLQRRAGQVIRPERFTHGSAAQRSHWFRRGLELGSLEACNEVVQ